MPKFLIPLAILILLIALRKDAKCSVANGDANYDFGASFLLGSDILSSTSSAAILAKRDAGPRVAINGSSPTFFDKATIDPALPYFVGKRIRSRTLSPPRLGGKSCDEWPELAYKLNSDCLEFVKTNGAFVRDRSAGMNEGALIQKYGIDTYLLSQNLKC